VKNIRLTLAYDGTDFHGWQIQPGRATIQGTLGDVLQRITGERVIVHGAGRTDAGVHALGQVAHFHTASRLTAGAFQRALNALLPPTIRVVQAEEVEPQFHARWQALGKTYLYRIYRSPVLPPFLHRYVLYYPFPLDEPAMQEAARQFEGRHDFTAFAAPAADDEEGGRNPEREVFGCTVARLPAGWSSLERFGFGQGEELLVVVRGRSFLRHMVRKIVGTLLEVGRGRLQPGDIAALFEARDRSRSGPTVPPQGLFLASVEYAEPWRAALASRRDAAPEPENR
jgi:tRNA pseudouridine38-40 synthase